MRVRLVGTGGPEGWPVLSTGKLHGRASCGSSATRLTCPPASASRLPRARDDYGDGTDSEGDAAMAVARVTEIISGSKKSFEDAIAQGIKRASKTLDNVSGAWIKGQKVVIEKGKITEYRVQLEVTFVLKD